MYFWHGKWEGSPDSRNVIMCYSSNPVSKIDNATDDLPTSYSLSSQHRFVFWPEYRGHLYYHIRPHTDTLVVLSLYVDDHYQSLGFGSAILYFLEHDVIPTLHGKIRRIQLQVLSMEQERAHNFYLKNGFNDMITTSANGVPTEALYMEKFVD